MKRIVANGLLACCSLAAAEEPPASPVVINVTLASDYLFRGISQTQEKHAIQGGLTYTHDSGFHGSMWGSNINFKPKDKPNPDNDNADLELDYGAGYGGKFSNALTWDLSAVYYSYPGSKPQGHAQYGYWEVLPTAVYDLGSAKITGQFAYSPDFFGPAKSGMYLMAGLDVPLPNDFALNAHLGEQWLKSDKDLPVSQTFVDANTAYLPKSYTEWKLGVSKQISGFGVELAYFSTSLSKDKCQAFAGQRDLCSARAMLTLSKNF